MRLKIAMLGLLLLFTTIGFVIGCKWYEFQYDDICLDMGGGRMPGNYAICVVVETLEEE
ncbi:MAG: hypothetical protein COA36_17205 [Desulfotalea sp.]|nr:MAG: hypothetical protein COA36_17205 [Desulfotalea sp.]